MATFEKASRAEGRPGGAVRVTIPAAVAHDLGAFQEGIAAVLGRLGHQSCCSGFDISFEQERELVLTESLDVRPLGPTPEPWGPHPEPWRDRMVTVTLPQEVGASLEHVHQAVARVAGRLGCQQCCSGFDLRFRQELDFVVDPQLNVRAVADQR